MPEHVDLFDREKTCAVCFDPVHEGETCAAIDEFTRSMTGQTHVCGCTESISIEEAGWIPVSEGRSGRFEIQRKRRQGMQTSNRSLKKVQVDLAGRKQHGRRADEPGRRLERPDRLR